MLLFSSGRFSTEEQPGSLVVTAASFCSCFSSAQHAGVGLRAKGATLTAEPWEGSTPHPNSCGDIRLILLNQGMGQLCFAVIQWRGLGGCGAGNVPNVKPQGRVVLDLTGRRLHHGGQAQHTLWVGPTGKNCGAPPMLGPSLLSKAS